MQKICVVLEVPSIGQSFDIMMPTYIAIGEAIDMLTGAVRELSAGQYVRTGEEILCRRDGAQLLKRSRTAGDYGVCDGEHLILF